MCKLGGMISIFFRHIRKQRANQAQSQYPFSQSFHYWLGFGFLDFIHGLLLEAPRVEGKHQQTKKQANLLCTCTHTCVISGASKSNNAHSHK